MTLLEKIFGRKRQSSLHSSDDQVKQIQETTDTLWKTIKDALGFYNSIACQCAFPRFRQYTTIDCAETQNNFHMSETEGFIRQSHYFFEAMEIDKGQECSKAIYTCKKCSSTYDYGWSDFSINVSRSYLKPRKILVDQIGADPIIPFPFVVGPIGHSLPERKLFQYMELELFAKYITELKNGA